MPETRDAGRTADAPGRDGPHGAGRAGAAGRDHAPGASPAAAPAIRLAPSSRVPLRDQIAVQMASALRARDYDAGDRLPSARALSRRLGVHRETVRGAYRSLAGRGLVEVRPGSGAYVASPPAGAFRSFLARERAAGRSFGDVDRLLDRWRRAVAARRVTVVGPEEQIRRVWVAELRPDLEPAGVSLAHLSPEEARRRPRRLHRTVTVGPAAALAALEDRLPPWTETLVLRAGPPPRVRRLLLRLPVGSVVALVTRSPLLRRQIRELAASLRDGDVAVTAVGPDGGSRRDRALRVARFVLADMACRPGLRRRVGRERLLTLRHLAPETGRQLARCFGPPPAPGAASGRRTGDSPKAPRPAAGTEPEPARDREHDAGRAGSPPDGRPTRTGGSPRR